MTAAGIRGPEVQNRDHEETRGGGESRGGRIDRPACLDGQDDAPLFGLMDIVNGWLKRRWLIIGGVILCVLLTAVYYKLQDPVFTASASFLPSRTQDMSSRIDRAFGTGAAYDPYEADTLSEYYNSLITSRTLLERVMKKKFAAGPQKEETDLIAYYQVKGNDDESRLGETINAFLSDLDLSAPPQEGYGRPPSVMLIRVSLKDPHLAAAVANEVLAQLSIYLQDIKDSKAAKSRQFIENQLADNQKLLKNAEAEQAAFLSRNKKIVTPELEAERDRFKRNVTVQEEVFITLKKQLELAKIEEQEKRPSIEIINQAYPPLRKSWPAIKRKAVSAGLLSLFLLSVLAIGIDLIRKTIPRMPENSELGRTLAEIKGDAANIGRLLGIGAGPKPGKR